jgi:glutamyl-tRNA synthetase
MSSGGWAVLVAGVRELDEGEPGPVEEVLDRICAETHSNRRRMFMTTRIAVAGPPVSPPLHETIAALGRGRTVGRLRAASDLILG